ncbi:MAG TPA: IS3 family transposase [Erysipelothrix sp.]|nr:IS3 family transposase [Erysipelothrix sp.]
MFRFIEGYQGPLSIAETCTILKVSRAGYYKHKQRCPSATEIENEVLSELLSAIFQEHKERYGSRRIQFILKRDYQLAVSRRRITRLLQAQGMYTRGTRRKYRRQQQENPVVQNNKVNQNFEVSSKNILWFGDITYIQTAEGTLYLSSYIDAYSRRVVGYQIENHMRDELVIECLIAAVNREKPKPGLIIHVDQGTQYTGHRFFDAIQDHELVLSHSRKGNPYDNAVMESFYKTLKREVLEKYGFKTKSDAVMIIVDYLENYYNSKRIHSSLNYLTPDEYILSPN